jgi:UV DNA damage endonuclease
MIRWGLCCLFVDAPIRFRTTTVAYLKRTDDPTSHLHAIIRDNVEALKAAINYCADNGIGAFRVNSHFCPVCTHPEVGYSFESLPADIHKGLTECHQLAKDRNIRLSFHPDQFVVINSPREDVVDKSLQEIEWHIELAGAIGADVINIHGGGAYGDKESALKRFVENSKRLSSLSMLTVENDDKTYTPQDLLPVCHELGIPLVYDVHHHRCNPDDLSIEEATDLALATWDREPLFHISSPKEKGSSRHHDYLNIRDLPDCWKGLDITVDVEAKAKERAIARILKRL